MVGSANQSYIVRFAHGPLAMEKRGKGRWPLQNFKAAKSIWGLWPSTVLKRIMLRRWLYLSGRDLYSRPHVKLYLRTGSSAYSRPRAESEGAQRSHFDVKNPVERALSV